MHTGDHKEQKIYPLVSIDEIYSAKNQFWRTIDDVPIRPNFELYTAVSSNGAIHITAYSDVEGNMVISDGRKVSHTISDSAADLNPLGITNDLMASAGVVNEMISDLQPSVKTVNGFILYSLWIFSINTVLKKTETGK